MTDVCNVAEADQVDQKVVMKEEDIKEEPCDYMIACQEIEQKPIADLNCSTEAYIAEDGTYDDTHFDEFTTETDIETDISSNEIIQTEVMHEVKKEGDVEERGNLMEGK